jgi:hypothetical protein
MKKCYLALLAVVTFSSGCASWSKKMVNKAISGKNEANSYRDAIMHACEKQKKQCIEEGHTSPLSPCKPMQECLSNTVFPAAWALGRSIAAYRIVLKAVYLRKRALANGNRERAKYNRKIAEMAIDLLNRSIKRLQWIFRFSAERSRE